MYKFIGLDEQQQDISLPAVAMEFEGEYIEDLIEGYRTLTVEGREVVDTNIKEISDVSGLDGSIFLGETIANREITVRFYLESDTSENYQIKLNRLKEILKQRRNTVVKVSFKDESDYFYKVVVVGLEDINISGNNTVSKIILKTVDPFKYSKELKVSTDRTHVVRRRYNYSHSFERIEIVQRDSSDYLEIQNETTGAKIRLTQPSRTGDTIVIDFTTNKITLNSNDITNKLAFEVSQFPDFEINTGDRLDVAGGILRVKWQWRDKVL